MKIVKKTNHGIIVPTLVLAVSLVLSACNDKTSDSSDPSQTKDPGVLAQQAIDHAQAKYSESAQAGYAWASAKSALDSAIQSLETGDFETALANAEQTTGLAEASLLQAQAEKSQWLERFPKAPAQKAAAPAPAPATDAP